MSWLPSILNPVSAAIAAAIVVPSLLLLYFLKLRRKEMPIGSTLLWKKSVQDLQVNAPFQRLRRNLLLFLQLAALLALVFAFARPVSFHKGEVGDNSLILIDRSASMSVADVNGKTRLDEAKRLAREQIQSLTKGARAGVIAFDSSAQMVQQMTDDKQALLNAIDGIRPTDQSTRLKMAYTLAEASIGLNPEQMKEGQVAVPDLFVYSDGRVLDGSELSFRGRVTYSKLGTDNAGNLAIVALSARRNYERPNEVTVFARLANYGPEPTNADIDLSVAEIDPADPTSLNFVRRQIKESATLLPDRYTEEQRKAAEAAGTIARDSVEFRIDLTTAAVIRVEQMNKTGDSLKVDDVAQVVVPPPRSLAVALVTEGNYFLERAVSAMGQQKPTILTPAQYDAAVPTEYDVLIFDRHSPKALPSSGNFVYFGAIPPGLPLKQAVDAANVPQFVADVNVLDWQRDHPILRTLNLSKVFAAEVIKLDVPVDSETLIEGTTVPLLVMYRGQRSTHLVCAFDVLQSNWPMRETFPYFLYNTMQFLSLGSEMDVREGYAPGSMPRIPRPNLLRAGGSELKDLTIIGPQGTRSMKVPDTGDVALPPLEHVGLYRTEPAVPQYEHIAVNLLDSNESNVMPSAIAPGGVGTAEDVMGGKRRLEWWWWLVAAVVLPLLLLEWWVYTRRVQV
jgi:Aerotolerance regulator N-terminal/von Willebrand factor type A domain